MTLIKDQQFKQWLTDLKARIRQSQIKAMIKVNDEMNRYNEYDKSGTGQDS